MPRRPPPIVAYKAPPVLHTSGTEEDILHMIARHYAVAAGFFHECAEKSGHDTAMLTRTDKDIIAINIEPD